MSNPTCDSTTLVTNAACYVTPTINPVQQKALLIYAKALQLAALGGTDYTSALNTTLVSDAATLTCGMTEPRKQAARIALAFGNATAAGATVPSSVSSKLSAVACIVNLDPSVLDSIDLLLTCKLGVNKAYPQ